MKWFLAVLKKYAVFNGRARRKEYWIYMLFYTIFAIVAIILDNVLGTAGQDTGSSGIISGLYSLALLLPTLAVTVRRLHDVGKSGWWFFISLIPFIGAIWLLVLLATDSQPSENKYGPNPKAVV